MKLVDTNVLLYAANESVPQHRASREWLAAALAGGETIGFPWVVLLGFVRIATNPRVLPRPLTVAQATDLVASWTGRPTAVAPEPGPRHLAVLTDLLVASGTAGNLTTDAHLAALAIEHRAAVVSFDRDLGRFGVEVVVPG